MYASKKIHEKLPYEVICQAFSFLNTTEGQKDTCVPATGKLIEAHKLPVTLSLVCKTWRNIVMDLPYLWTTIHIQVKKRPITKGTIDAAETRFKRSKKLGCHLFLAFPFHVFKSSDPEVIGDMVLNLVQPISPRLETLVLCVPAACLWSLQKLSPFHLPRLQTFIIRPPKDDNSKLRSLPNLSPDAFAHCSSLRNLELTHPTGLGMFQSMDPTGTLLAPVSRPFPNLTIFPYPGLQSLKLTDFALPLRLAIDIFHLATGLHYCQLKVSALRLGTHSPIASTSSGLLTHPNLRVLELCFTSGFISNFFRGLQTDLPQLEDLKISGTRDAQNLVSWGLPAELLDFMVRHPISLKRLEIRGVGRSFFSEGDAHLLNFLRMNDSIEVLALDELQASDISFIKELIWRNESAVTVQASHVGGQILPNLKYFSLADKHPHNLTDEVLIGFLCSRWDVIGESNGESEHGEHLSQTSSSSPAQLQKVILPQFWGGRATRSRNFGDLSRLQEEGLVFRFEGDPPENGDDWAT
ncbi:hypothetical protein BDN72DRAFT_847411 [Pluteus cervinus]|uniref:Uncharacterized protein n=1 Tax=Pluteus cervinus TaxID=181527 RepID=A0ACD3AD74_9AGAR|nr:hypothetical protein BDN72DRAFT_847411 [Pluteus cervinus]